MNRILPAAVLLMAFYGITERPAAAQEQVYYVVSETRKEPKDSPLKGKIKSESPAGITITLGKEDRTIPALDITQVVYATAVSPLDFRNPDGKLSRGMALDAKTKGKERRDLIQEALTGFRDLGATKAKDNPLAARYINYRIADIQYRQSLDDISLRPKAIQALEDYAKAFPGGWEIVPTLKTLARLHEEGNDIKKATSALERLADLAEAPKELRLEGNVAVSQMFMRAKNFTDAEKRLTTMLDSLPPGDPLRAQTQVYLVQCRVAQKKTAGAEKELQEAISGTSEPILRGIAYNVLGDIYRENMQIDEAFWAYLRVDTLYNLDANEHAKAIYYLSELFKEKKFGDRTGDPVRAKNYRERLSDKRFAESEYHKLVEKQP